MDRLCCSIEMEPKTLREATLSNAREAAVGILQKAAEEPLMIPTKEMGFVSMEMTEKKAETRGELNTLSELKESTEIIERSWDCQHIPTTSEESIEKSKITEPLSAPF